MSDLDYWTKALKKAEQELDAATRLADINAAAKKLMRAKEALERLQAACRQSDRDGPPPSRELMAARKLVAAVRPAINRGGTCS